MINEKRIVPVTNTDLLTLYGLILKVGGTTISTVSAGDTGVFSMTSGSGNKLADEPVKSFDFGSSVTSAVIYFVAAYDYEGFSVAGQAAQKSLLTAQRSIRLRFQAVQSQSQKSDYD